VDREINLHKTPVGELMTRNCKTVQPGMLAAEALAIMEASKINGLLVVDADGSWSARSACTTCCARAWFEGRTFATQHEQGLATEHTESTDKIIFATKSTKPA
jgi:CBS domain-containing protein